MLAERDMDTTETRTEEQLLQEIAALRGRIEELEVAARKRSAGEQELRAELEEKAVAALGQSERKFKDLVQSINAIVWEVDASSFDFTFVSEQAESILGYPVEQWLKEPSFWSSHIHPDDREAAVNYCMRCTEALANHEFEYRMIAKDGRIVWIRDLATVESSDGAPVRLRGVMFDVTERKELEAQLLQSQKMESLGRLAGGIAHDFNNLLTAIMGYADLSAATLPAVSRTRENIHEIKEAALRARDLTRQLLAFARRGVARPRVLDLGEMVSETSKLLRRLIGEDIELVLPPPTGTALITADAGQIEQVLVNLAVNARDAMPGGGTVTITTGVVTLGLQPGKPGALPPGSYVQLTVRDTGTGMSEEVRAHLFEPFFTTKETGKGTGLGLATCYGIVTQSGGRIEIESQGGHGTTVTILLPRATGVADAVASRRDAQPVPRGRETVLLVEDEPAVRSLSARILRLRGYTVLEAQHGEDALRIAAAYRGGPIHLLLTDVVMPQMGGEALAERFREAYPSTRVLFTSGYADSESFRIGVLGQGAAFLEKPFSPSALASKVREVLDT